MSPDQWVSIVAAIIGSGGLAGAAYLLKARPEAGSLVVDAANKVVVIMRDTIAEQERTIKKLSDYTAELEARIVRCNNLILEQTEDLARLAVKVVDLERRIANGGH